MYTEEERSRSESPRNEDTVQDGETEDGKFLPNECGRHPIIDNRCLKVAILLCVYRFF